MSSAATDKAWETLGRVDPYWVVISNDAYHGRRLTDQQLAAFLKSGSDHVDDIWRTCRHEFGEGFAPRRVLDFGCGTGVSTRALAAAAPAWQITGIDPSHESIECARRTSPNTARFVHDVGSGLPFADSAFDLVFTACVFHHIERAQHSSWVLEIQRVLKPQGRLFLFEHNPYNPLTRRSVRECPFDDGVTLLTGRYAAGVLRRAGFSVSGPTFYYFFPRAFGFLRPMERLLRWFPLGAQYYVTGRKREQA